MTTPTTTKPQVDTHLAIDLPAVVSAVLATTGRPQLHWVGHSMGGMLAVGALSRGMACAAAFRSITLLASGCFGAGSWHSLVAPLVTRAAAMGFHAGQVVPALANLRGLMRPLGWLVSSLFYVQGNVEPAVAKKLLGSFLSFIPSGVVAQVGGWLMGCCFNGVNRSTALTFNQPQPQPPTPYPPPPAVHGLAQLAARHHGV
jgi:pimeloyl-ACP methyl ester carboxylesterase